MNLPSDLQRLLPFVAVAVLAVAGVFLVMRGVGGGGGTSAADAQKVMNEALANQPKSGVLDLGFNMTVEAASPKGQKKSQTATATASGRFVEPASKEGPFALGQNDVKIRETEKGRTTKLRIVSAGENGYLQTGGRWYELKRRQARRVFNDSDTGRHESPLEEFAVGKWIQSPRIDGTAQVDGVAADRVVGQLNPDAFFADFDDGQSGFDNVLRDAQKSGEVELLVGKNDGILRKASVRSQVMAHVPGGTMQMATQFDFAFRDVNKPQRITAPRGALRPGAIDRVPAAALGSQAKPLLGKPPGTQRGTSGGGGSRRSGGSNSGSKRSDSKRSSQAYISCVQQAMDTAALERCQALLPRR
jgi:hypothetical protein